MEPVAGLEHESGVTLGELCRRVDRMEGAISSQLAQVTTALGALGPDLAAYRTTQVEVVRRLSVLEEARVAGEARTRATLVAVLIALVTSVSGILVAIIGVH